MERKLPSLADHVKRNPPYGKRFIFIFRLFSWYDENLWTRIPVLLFLQTGLFGILDKFHERKTFLSLISSNNSFTCFLSEGKTGHDLAYPYMPVYSWHTFRNQPVLYYSKSHVIIIKLIKKNIQKGEKHGCSVKTNQKRKKTSEYGG